jgi:general secretion pathway protein I
VFLDMTAKKNNSRVTLLEVMVALFIVAVALGGAIKVMSGAAQNSSRLTSKTFANWVALNKLTDLKIKGEWPKVGEDKGTEEMAGQEWRWVQATIKTEDDNIKRIEMSVWSAIDEDVDPFVTVVGFLAKP